MFYSLLKAYSRLAHRILFRRIRINRPEVLKQQGPILFAANHPNSFLDGIILTTLYDGALYSLARGDAFKSPKAGSWLRRLRLLPVYRQSEGAENLEHNYTTFDACLDVFAQGGSVLIFSEGRCENEWHLRPLKKGTARLAFAAWERDLPLTVMPTGFNYSSFLSLGKEVHVHFGQPVVREDFPDGSSTGTNNRLFNERLKAELSRLVYEIQPGDEQALRRHFPLRKRGWHLLPGLLGWVLHAPLYLGARRVARRFRTTGHYDSVVAGVLLLGYPVYLLLLAIAAFFVHPLALPSLLIVSPLTAPCAIRAFGK